MSGNQNPESTAIIRFPDCDPFNHLNNSRYLDYFMNAREDHLMNVYNFGIYQWVAKHKAGWVVSQNQIAYLQPAMLMEKVVMQSRLLRFGERDVLVEMTMWDSTKTRLKSVLWGTFVYFNIQTQRSEKHPDELITMFEERIRPLSQPATFEQRLLQIRDKKADEVL